MLHMNEERKKHWGLIALVGVLIVLFAIIFIKTDEKALDLSSATSSKTSCNVGVIAITGFLDTQGVANQIDSLKIAQGIRRLALNPRNRAIVLLIDSHGGTASAAEKISRATKEIDPPTVAFVRSAALSGGYWIAASTDYIVSLETATIGNIGVTSSYLEETSHNQKEGYVFNEIASGEYKEVGNPYKPLTETHRKYLQDANLDLFNIFKEHVMQSRRLSDAEFSKVSDGKFFVASKAKQIKLIDEIGGIPEIKGYISSVIGESENRILLCEPEQISASQSI